MSMQTENELNFELAEHEHLFRKFWRRKKGYIKQIQKSSQNCYWLISYSDVKYQQWSAAQSSNGRTSQTVCEWKTVHRKIVHYNHDWIASVRRTYCSVTTTAFCVKINNWIICLNRIFPELTKFETTTTREATIKRVNQFRGPIAKKKKKKNT